MTIATKRKKLHELIDTVNDSQVKEIYSFAEREIMDYGADSLSKQEKIELMKQASYDPLFLADMKEIDNDFGIADII
jgi:pyoverdine/dityrosine biosynthesis protein Dit1